MQRRTIIRAAGLTATLGLGMPIARSQTRRLRFCHLRSVDSPVHMGLVKAAASVP